MPNDTSVFGTLSSLAGDFFGGMNSTVPGGSGTSSGVTDPTQASAGTTQGIDPSTWAQTAITGDLGQTTPTGQQSQGQQGQNQQQNQSQNPLDMLRRALTGLQQNKKQQQQGNPYQIGGPAINMAQASPNAAVPGYPYEGASRQPEYGPGLNPGGPNYNSEGASNQPEYGPGLRPGGPDYNSEGADSQPEYGPGQTTPEVQGPNVPYPEGASNDPEYGPGRPTPQLPATRGGAVAPYQPPLEGEVIEPGRNITVRPQGPAGGGGAAPPVPPQTRQAPASFGGPSLGGLIRSLIPGLPAELAGALGGVGMVPFTATPAETGELPRYKGPSPEDYPDSTKYPQSQPGNPSVTKAPATGKPVQTIDPKTKKPVDPKTGHPVPTKVPTKKEPPTPEQGGEYQPKTGEARNKEWRGATEAPSSSGAAAPPSGYGPIMQDAHGVNLGLPRGLGHLAQAALPLLALGLMAGLGGKRNRGHVIPGGPRGFGGYGHPGGRGPWPYHHPTFGWQAHNFHPGGDWRPMRPSTAYAYPNFNSNVNPFLAYWAGTQQNQQQQQAQPGQQGQGQGPYGPGHHFGGESGNQSGGGQQGGNPWQTGGGQPDSQWKGSGLGDNPFLATLTGQETGGGQNIISRTDKDSHGLTLAQGGNPSEISSGYFQIQNYPGGTWQTYGKLAGIDLSKYPTPLSAPLDVQWKVAQQIPIGQWGEDTQRALRQRGYNYNPSTPLGLVAQQYGNINIAGSSNPDRTQTGGSTNPNPQGNVAMQ